MRMRKLYVGVRRTLTALTLLLALTSLTFAWSPSSKLEWGAVAQNMIGQPITPGGYRIYSAAKAGGPYTLLKDVGLTATPQTPSVLIKDLGLATVPAYLVVTAYDGQQRESGYSNEVALPLDATSPGAPGNLRLVP